MSKTVHRFTLAAGCVASMLLAQTILAQPPKHFEVTTPDDLVDDIVGDGICANGNGGCSLRAAVQEANVAGEETVILLQDGQTLSLALDGISDNEAVSGDLDITGQVVIRGNNAIIDAATLDRAIDVMPGASLEVADLTIMNGMANNEGGGSIRNAGELTLTRVTIMNSSAVGASAAGGAILNTEGTLVINDSQLTGNSADRSGGAIEVQGGTVLVNRSLLADNEAGPTPGNGGAVHVEETGALTVRLTQFEGNTAAQQGGALWNAESSSVTIDNSLFVENIAQGGEEGAGGGAVYNNGTMAVTRSQFRDNQATAESGAGGALYNNGGDLVITRGTFERNMASRAGGAIEVDGGVVAMANSALFENQATGFPGNGGGLHVTGAAQVQIENSDFRENMAAAEGGGVWNSLQGNMAIRNTRYEYNTAGGHDSEEGGGGLFNAGGTMAIENSFFRNNTATGEAGSGGGMFNHRGTVVMAGTEFFGNEAQRAGGGIETFDGFLTLTDVRLFQNSALSSPGNGGGLHVTGTGRVQIASSQISGNTAASEGGGLWNSASGRMTIVTSVVEDNTASGEDADNGGGGIFNDGGILSVTGSTVTNNYSDGESGSGGGVFNNQGNFALIGTILSGNSAQRAGGALELRLGITAVAGTTITENLAGPAPGNGGGIHVSEGGTVVVASSVVSNNTASSEGGGLWNAPGGAMSLTQTQVTGNTAFGDPDDEGGGGLFNEQGFLTIENSVIAQNTASGIGGAGGGIFNNDGSLEVTRTLIASNQSQSFGGGVEANFGITELSQVSLVANTTGESPGDGGGLHLRGTGEVTIDASQVLFNVAENQGGGLWNSEDGTMTVTNTTITNNFAPEGANAFNAGGLFTIDGVLVPEI